MLYDVCTNNGGMEISNPVTYDGNRKVAYGYAELLTRYSVLYNVIKQYEVEKGV